MKERISLLEFVLNELYPKPSSKADHIVIIIVIGCVEELLLRAAEPQEEEAAGALLQEEREVLAPRDRQALARHGRGADRVARPFGRDTFEFPERPCRAGAGRGFRRRSAAGFVRI